MRTSILFISLALILCAQVYAGELAAGKWTNPTIKTQTDAACCVPDSIELVGSGSSFKAQYSFSTTDIFCKFLFSTNELADWFVGTKTKPELSVAKKSDASGDYYGASLKLLNAAPLESFRYNLNSDSKLNVINVAQTKENKEGVKTSYIAGQICDFTMKDFKPASATSGTSDTSSPSGTSGYFGIPTMYLVAGGVGLLLFICILCKCRGGKQVIVVQGGGYANHGNYQQPNIHYKNPYSKA